MTKVYRTDDPTRWGTGKGSNLAPVEFDLNNWDDETRLTALEQHQTNAVGISGFSQPSPTQFLVQMDDSTTRGPFTLPTGAWTFRGTWAPSTVYAVNDVVAYSTSVYIVLVAHTSASTFDPGATDGMGHNLYGLLFTVEGSLPAGGVANQALIKTSSTDFAATWAYLTVAGMHDVLQTSAPADGDLFYYAGGAFGYLAPSSLTIASSQITGFDFSNLADVSLTSPLNDNDLAQWNGSHWTNIQPSTLTLGVAQLRPSTVTALGTSGTVSLDPTLGNVFTITPAGDVTLNAASAPAAAEITIIVLTSGTSSFNITPTTTFISTGALATGTVDAKTFTLKFVGDGTNMNEVSRTVAMP